MARTLKPGSPVTGTAPQYQVKMPDFKQLDEMGDAKVKAGLQSFEVYADTLIKTESAKLYQQFHNDPIQLSNGFTKLGSMLDGLPKEIQDKYRNKMYLTGVALVQKAQQNQIEEQDAQTKVNADTNTEISKQLLAQSYQNVLKNATAKKEDYDEVANSVFLQQVMTLNDIADLKDATGRNMYSESQRKKIRNIDDLELEGFKQFFDAMLINDNDKLDASTEYYQKNLLAPERFMKDNYMNRETYDKVRAYAEKELKRAGAEIQKMKFKQSVRDYTETQIEDLPGRLTALKEAGVLPKEMISKLEKTNLKFNEIDPSKPESPVAMLDLLDIMRNLQYAPVPQTEAEQQKILEQGTATLDTIAEYGQTYGLSPEKVKQMRETVVTMETDAAFAPILQNFNDIVDNFESKLNTVRKASSGKSGWSVLTLHDNMDVNETKKLIELNNLLSDATNIINEQIRNKDWAGVRETQRKVQETAAQIYYDWIDWQAQAQNKDNISYHNGQAIKVKNFTPNGDIVVEKLN